MFHNYVKLPEGMHLEQPCWELQDLQNGDEVGLRKISWPEIYDVRPFGKFNITLWWWSIGCPARKNNTHAFEMG